MSVLFPGMYEDLKEYLNWYDTRRDTRFAADAPVIGLVLQRSHLVTGDEGHYAGVVSELEAQGAKASPTSFYMTASSDADPAYFAVGLFHLFKACLVLH